MVDTVEVNVDVGTAGDAGPSPSWGNAWIVDTSEESEGLISNDTPREYYRASSVGVDFGSGSAAHEYAKEALENGANSIGVIRAGSPTTDLGPTYDVLKDEEVDIVTITNQASSGTGDIDDEHVIQCTENDWTAILDKDFSTTDTSTLTSTKENYEQKNVYFVAHQSAEPASAATAGRMTEIRPWDKMKWGELDLEAEEIPSNDRSQLSQNGINTVTNLKGDWVLSNGLTTDASNETLYKYIGTWRTERFLKKSLKSAMIGFIKETEIPYTEDGIGMIKDRINRLLSEFVDNGAIVDNFDISMPKMEDIDEQERVDRTLNGVEITVQLAGRIQKIRMNVSMNI